jgi:mannose-6-phosphate isomerase-like protein (cupin superfamily)
MEFQPVDIDAKFGLFSELWSPKVIGKINNYLIKVGKLQGDFVWHKHTDTDELFIVHKGVLQIEFRDGQVVLKPGQMFVVPKGVEHRPHADQECQIILFEPEATLNTGDAKSEMTVEKLEWI